MDNKLNKNLVVKKTPGTASRIIDGEAVVILPEKGLVRVLNEVASFIWKAIDDKKSIQEIAYLLTQEFQVSKNKALADTKEFIEELVEKGMVEIAKNNQSPNSKHQ